MGINRTVNTDVWNDVEITELFTPADRLFWFWLLTNPHNEITGVCNISDRTIAYELGYSVDTVRSLKDRFKNIYHKIDIDENEILIINWFKFNWTTSSKLNSCVDKKIVNIKSEKFRDYVKELVNCDTKEDRVSIGYRYVTKSKSNTKSISKSNTNTKSITKPKSNTKPKIVIDYDSEFKQLWNQYPRKKGKASAYKSFVKFRKEETTFEEIQKGLDGLNNSVIVNKTETQFIPHGSTWFSEQQWEDDYAITKKKSTMDYLNEMEMRLENE
jgi:hypothetical protein